MARSLPLTNDELLLFGLVSRLDRVGFFLALLVRFVGVVGEVVDRHAVDVVTTKTEPATTMLLPSDSE